MSDINYLKEIRQADKINDYICYLNDVKRNLNTFKSNMNREWQGNEVANINIAIDNLIQKINQVNLNLTSISSDIKVVAKEVKNEQDAQKEANK